jgi:uncharacterized membrane protein YhaH (DUF805 family)
LGVSKILF